MSKRASERASRRASVTRLRLRLNTKVASSQGRRKVAERKSQTDERLPAVAGRDVGVNGLAWPTTCVNSQTKVARERGSMMGATEHLVRSSPRTRMTAHLRGHLDAFQRRLLVCRRLWARVEVVMMARA